MMMNTYIQQTTYIYLYAPESDWWPVLQKLKNLPMTVMVLEHEIR